MGAGCGGSEIDQRVTLHMALLYYTCYTILAPTITFTLPPFHPSLFLA